MARRNIFELLAGSSIEEDIHALDLLIHSTHFNYYISYHVFDTTIEQYANKSFHNWTMRGSAVSLNNVRERLGFQDFKRFISNGDNQIMYLEYALNVLDLFSKVEDLPSCINEPVYINAVHNCNLIVEKLALKPIKLNLQMGSFILVPTDPIAVSVAEKMSEKDISIQILQYHHHLLKGDIEKKKSILLAMSLLFEKDRFAMENGPYKQLTKDIGFVLNKFNIRHSFSSTVFSSFSKQELEKVYDDLYEMLVTWFSALSYNNEISKRIEHFRSITKDNSEK